MILGLSILPLGVAVACGASTAPAPAAPSPSASGFAPGAASSAPAPAERPFARTVLEAQTMIQDQVDGKMTTLWKCVDAYRKARGEPHKSVVVDVGIDQEGNLLGVKAASTKQGDLDPTLKQCLWDTLHGLPFPRSHAGIITVRQTFSDTDVSR